MENQMKPMNETLGEKLIRCGWVTNFNVKTLVKLIEEHFSSRIPYAPTPISVNDRLPGPEDCDEDGWCWWFDSYYQMWKLDSEHTDWAGKILYTYWLPYNSLPIIPYQLKDGKVE